MKKRVSALILALSFLLAGCSGTSRASVQYEPLPAQEIVRSHVAFSDMAYERPNIALLLSDLEVLQGRYFAADTAQQRDNVMTQINERLLYFMTMYALADLRNAMDVTDSYYAAEIACLSQARTEIAQCTRQFYEQLLQPAHEALAKELLSDWEYEDLLRNFCIGSEETQPLRAAEEQLVQQYAASVAQMGTVNSAVDLCETYYKTWSGWFIELADLRHAQAKALGYTDFLSLAWDRMGRGDYTPDDVARFRESVKTHLVPIYRRLLEQAAARTGHDLPPLYILDDLAPTPEAAPEHDALLEAFRTVYAQMSPETGECMEYLLAYRLYDLLPSPTKYPGGFQEYIYGYASPFIFGNFRGTSEDISLFAHEFGHFFASYRKINPDPAHFRDGDRTMDIREMQSSGMEILTMRWYDELFGPAAGQFEAAGVIELFGLIIDCCMYDEWQCEVYTNWERISAQPDPAAELDAISRDLRQTYYGTLDYTGLAPYGDGKMWIAKTHLFETPFYMIDYALAYSVTLQLYPISQTDWDSAFSIYLAMLDAPYGSSFSQVVAAGGLCSPFSDRTMRELAAVLHQTAAKAAN